MSTWRKPSLNRGGVLRHQLSATYNTNLEAIPRWIDPHTDLVLCVPKVPLKPGLKAQHLLFNKHVLFVGDRLTTQR